MKTATWQHPHTFEEGKQFLTEGNHIDYEVKHEGHHGALMTREGWLESVEDHGIIDYDGFGDQVTQEGRLIGRIRPSAAKEILAETAYILWYNR